MKNLLYLLLSATLIFASSCKDDDCDPGSLETNIVGEWSVSALGLPAGDVRFNANGTLDDLDDALIDSEFGGITVDEKTYVVNSNSSITLYARQGGNTLGSQDVDIVSFNCDEIVAELQGFQFTLERN